MKKLSIIVAALLVASTSLFSQTKAGKTDTTTHTVLYTCPHHSDVMTHESGKCPKCGMELMLSKKEQFA